MEVYRNDLFHGSADARVCFNGDISTTRVSVPGVPNNADIVTDAAAYLKSVCVELAGDEEAEQKVEHLVIDVEAREV